MRYKYILLFVICISVSCGQKEALSSLEKEKIINELERIHDLDQKYAGLPPAKLFDKFSYKRAWEIFEKSKDSINLLNQQKIKHMFKTYGYLGYKEVGKDASQNFWISIQHADNDVQFQKEALDALKIEIANNNASKSNYAMLEDRVNVNLEKKQRFGSQVTYTNFGQAIPKNGLKDSINIEKLRKEYDLPPFKEYYNDMTLSHFEMNKKNFLSKGITAPKLYE